MTYPAVVAHPASRAQEDGYATRTRRSLLPVVAVGLALVAVAVVLSLLVGNRLLSPEQVWTALTGGPVSPDVRGIVDARVDRTLIGLVVGACTAVAGAVLQGVTRNPLADPGILGLSSGAALFVVAGIQLGLLTTVGAYVWAALLGVLAAAAIVQGIAMMAPARSQPVTMTLAGAAVTAAVQSLIGALLINDWAALDQFRFWQVGSVAGRPASTILSVLPFVVVGLLLSLTSAAVLNASALGDDLARALGQRVVLQRGLAALGAILLTAAATALAGPIAFVGLVVPHAVRLLAGPDYRQVLAGSLLGGAALVVLTDTLGRVVMPSTEVQVGIMSAVLGAPVLLLLVRRVGRSPR